MNKDKLNLARWDQRIRRADELAVVYPFAADVLRFYQRVAIFQKGLYCYLRESPATNLRHLLPKLPDFLAEIETSAPEPVAQRAREWKSQGADRSHEMLASYWRATSAAGDPEALLASLFLQPYAEHLAEQAETAPRHETPAVCPFCARKPVVGVLRPEGDGAKRSLICLMCSTEWPYGRIICPACGEQTVENLAIYSADQFQHVRVEACGTCGCYIKTVDLTRNGRAVPIVDELATIPLNLWAQQQGYAKVQTNILGI
ncbi:MAG TPA: formate dehydrogenase accessory protein FdhE [Bryobacteraceae bacterium]|nr:formate dehydrogenase accessory protein FdhE [Bryobacteraceae bacterium]